MQRFPEVGPLEWLGHGAIEIGDEVQHLVLEIVGGSEVASPQQLTDQDTQPQLDLIQPGRMLRRVVEDDATAAGAGSRHRGCRRSGKW